MSGSIPLLLVAGILALGCRPAPQPERALTPAEEAAITETMRGAMTEFVAAENQMTCEDQGAVLKFFDWSGPGLIDGNDSIATLYPGDAWPTLIREGACSREREEVTLETLLIRVLSRDLASVSWTYRATHILRDAPPEYSRGAVLQVFRRTPNGWKSPVGMSTHLPVTQ